MTKGNPIFKFRTTPEDTLVINEARDVYLGLNNDSATVRVLLRMGKSKVADFFHHAEDVTHPLKYSEIDYFTSALKLYLKQQKRERENKKD